ncbi:MAG: response regulator [Spirochaetales bacterium]|nr:response regulator [Spirochaetales bacterium]
MNIIVVDDDEVVLASCNRILAGEGHVVTLAPSVGQAVELLHSEQFDLLLLDVIMPEYDGIQLMGAVKERRLDLPILVMSGYPTKETVERALGAGAAHFVAKPFTPAELLDAIRVVTGKANSDQEDPNGNIKHTGD